MTETYLLGFAQNALLVTISLGLPVLGVSLVIGIIISMFQAATQINEVTLTFIPKIAAVIVVLMIMGSWMAQQLLSFTANVFMSLPNLPR